MAWGLRFGCAPFFRTIIPWCFSWGLPHTHSLPLRVCFQIDVIHRILPEGPGKSRRHHFRVDVPPGNPTHGNDTTVPVSVLGLASCLSEMNEMFDLFDRFLTAWPRAATSRSAFLPAFGSVYAVKPIANASDIECVSVDNPHRVRSRRRRANQHRHNNQKQYENVPIPPDPFRDARSTSPLFQLEVP